jgi:F-type H+-transporting ATPase subunit d
VTKAQETERKIDVELKELRQTLANIEDARPFEQLTVSSLYSFQLSYSKPSFQTNDVAQAHPRILKAVETMLKKGKWTVPGWCLIYIPFKICF